VRSKIPKSRRRVRDNCGCTRTQILPGETHERWLAGEHPVEGRAEGVDIAADAGPSGLRFHDPHSDLWGQRLRTARGVAEAHQVYETCQPEVTKQDVLVPIEKKIVRLDVGMNEATDYVRCGVSPPRVTRYPACQFV